jgi:hypothetical protein
MVFKPGQSGNPKGRRKLDPAFEEAVKKAAKPALAQIELLAKTSDDDSVRLKASTWLAERAFGKAPEEINVETTGPMIAVIKEG